MSLLRQLLPGAFAVAMLGAIETLLSAVVADGMARTKHDPDAELLALGISNVVTPFFGGIPATGAIARTATNFRSGGRTPIASMVHALILLLAVLLLAPLIAYLARRYGRRVRGGFLMAGILLGFGEVLDPPSKHIVEAQGGEEKPSPENDEPK